jgi:hypothetical protein
MPKLISLIGVTAMLLSLTTISSHAEDLPLSASQDSNFVPQTAFCERQTFRLESYAEVPKWLDYLAGLRTGRTAPPSLDCPSSTLRAMVGVLSSQDETAASDARIAFAASYAATAMEPDSVARALDQSGNFRYLNDATLASFLWLLCLGTGKARGHCIENAVRELPDAYLETSPVFCDFASFEVGSSENEYIEWPRETSEFPLLCSASDGASFAGSGRAEDWLARIEASFSKE